MMNDLMLNASKSEVIELGTAAQLKKCIPQNSYVISDTSITPSNAVKIVGVILDNHLTFERFISATCSACSHHIKALRHIRPLLDLETANTIACSSVLSRLDYCNSLLAGTTAHNISRLQRIQNNAAKVVCQSMRRDSPSVAMQRLHWLPIKQRIDYKVATLTFNALTRGSPAYIRDLITEYKPIRTLRSSSNNLLVVPSTQNNTILANRAFQNYAPKLWNSLPDNLRCVTAASAAPHRPNDSITTVNSFKCRLKTVLFTSAFTG